MYTDFWLAKTDSYGYKEWSQTYGGTDGDYAHSLVETSDGGYTIAGWTNSFGAGKGDFWLVKTDSYGNIEWNQTYGGTDGDYAHSLVETLDGGYALAGDTGSSDMESLDVWLVKADIQGNMEWNKTYGGTNADYAYSLVQTSDGGYAIAGGTSSFGPGDANFWLIKTDAQGIPEFPSWTILSLVLAATLTAIVYRKKLYKTQTQQSY